MNIKRIIWVIAVIVLALFIVVAVAVWGYTQRVHEFDSNAYADEIEEFPSDKVLGPVTSAKDAKEKAEAVWIEIYGEDVENQKPYSVSYDANTGVWKVQGYLPWYMVGGVANILIRESDGTVLAVWHYK